MKSEINIKIKELKDGSLDEKIATKGDANIIINGLIGALYTLCKNNFVDINMVCEALKEKGTNIKVK